ncbi:MAG TPA: hypothetical protein VGN60_01465 [Devosia sp.]|nr:hypothetical protein [Devosia sp.]
MIGRLFAIAGISVALAACSDQGGTYTLYRNSALDPSMRIHVASFDSGDGAEYNQENCQVAADLFGGQTGISTRFWCEKGRFEQ